MNGKILYLVLAFILLFPVRVKSEETIIYNDINSFLYDDFEKEIKWNAGGVSIPKLYLSNKIVKSGEASLRVDYDMSEPKHEYCTLARRLEEPVTEYNGIAIWVYGDSSENIFQIDLVLADGQHYRQTTHINWEEWKQVVMPFKKFNYAYGGKQATGLDLELVTILEIYIEEDTSTTIQEGTIYLDEMRFTKKIKK